MLKEFLDKFEGFNLIDIGSSGDLDKIWKPYKSYINLIGFDPNEEECKRMSAIPSGFKSTKYIPYAIGGASEENILYKTKDIYCYSLLKPNTEWLDRFSFSDLFHVIGQEKIQTRSLTDIPELKGFSPDIIKADTQGLELPILKASGEFLDNAFYVETETGFVENYIGETTYSQMDEFMRSKGFLLFDINVSHRISRKNIFSAIQTNAEQILWCEAVWLKDYVALFKQNTRIKDIMNREKILKSLVLCAIQGCIDYGYEIANLACEHHLLTRKELKSLEIKEGWVIADPVVNSVNDSHILSSLINYTLRLFPVSMRKQIKIQADLAVHQKHLLR